MFTGIIEQMGIVLSNTVVESGNKLLISAQFCELEAGESIAVNGVCLTWLPEAGNYLGFDLSPETLAKTNLGTLCQGDQVNLERAMLASTRFGGHYVSGHVDTPAQIVKITVIDNYLEIRLGGFEDHHQLYLIKKGSITVEGVSLTINEIRNEEVFLMLVPHTLTRTTLKNLTAGQWVNVEFDYLTRIVAHQLGMINFLNK